MTTSRTWSPATPARQPLPKVMPPPPPGLAPVTGTDGSEDESGTTPEEATTPQATSQDATSNDTTFDDNTSNDNKPDESVVEEVDEVAAALGALVATRSEAGD